MRSDAWPWAMLSPPAMARPLGQLVAPVRTTSASSLQKNVGLKISRNGSLATWIGSAACAAANQPVAEASASVTISSLGSISMTLPRGVPYLDSACRVGVPFARVVARQWPLRLLGHWCYPHE